MIAPLLALALVVVAADLSAHGRPCTPYAEVCRGSVIYTCSPGGHWRRGIDCARAGRRDRVTVCSQEIDGSAICVENGGATP